MVDQLGSTPPPQQKRGCMKKHVISLMSLLIVLGAGALSVNAQSGYGIKANVPFDFNVGDKTFQAGKVTAHRRSLSGGEPLVITSSDCRTNAVQLSRNMQEGRRSDSAKLVFHRYGNRYYLAQVWMSGDVGIELPKSKSEQAFQREMRHLAKNSPEPERITVLATVQ